MTTKVHAVTDGLGNPLRFLLSTGNRHDICMAQELLESFDLNGKIILADKGYDSDNFVRWIEQQGGIAVIPSRISAKTPRNIDRHTYKERHLSQIKEQSSFCHQIREEGSLFPRRYFPCLHPCLVTLIVLKHSLVVLEYIFYS